jgi:hypothetical protein
MIFNIFTREEGTKTVFLGIKTSVVNKHFTVIREIVDKSKTFTIIKPLNTTYMTGCRTIDGNIARSTH